MALSGEQIAQAVIKDCRRHRLAGYEIRQRRSELVGKWLRSTNWFLRDYPTIEAQTLLYKEIERHMFRLTTPKQTAKKAVSKDTRQLRLDL